MQLFNSMYDQVEILNWGCDLRSWQGMGALLFSFHWVGSDLERVLGCKTGISLCY